MKGKGLKLLAVALTLMAVSLALPTPASAIPATYYVSPTGDDATGNGSEGNPWRTIQKGVDSATTGDTIKVMDDDDVNTDDYTENITVNKSLTIERYNDTGANPQVKTNDTFQHVFRVTADNVTIRGLDIYGATVSNRAGVYLTSGTSGSTISNNRLGWDSGHRNRNGIRPVRFRQQYHLRQHRQLKQQRWHLPGKFRPQYHLGRHLQLKLQ